MIGGYVITFHTHYEAMLCLRTLEKDEAAQNGAIAVKLIPVPRELSSGCGTAVKVMIKDGAVFGAENFANIKRDEVFSFDAAGTYTAADK
ncbi:DUF3343 domain-containing protein [Treponema vincentii]|uniref:DUF3343 domain-containing protein n=1 Tax=Treponema vincentii TaxID=69710 RepID=UPI001BAF1068|nr:DUF3343 domain-containing protein [Treponema vincentii]QUY17137.1 DUF3343 domain-containing protein [Treponema vincentii]